MTAPHYYASTSGILVDRFLKYGMYPFAYGAGLAMFKDHERATRAAQVICTTAAMGITTTFLGLESQMINDSTSRAVAASMGVDTKEVEFSDLKRSSNIIAKKAHDDLMRLQWYRYGTDLLFMLPAAVEWGYGKFTKAQVPRSKDIVDSFDDRSNNHFLKKPDNNYTRVAAFLQGHVGWAMSAYAAKAAYWAYETFSVPKTAYYEVVKVRENLESTGRDIRPDDIKAIYQRARTDRGLKMVSNNSKKECDALRSLFTRMADEYNRHDGKFGIAEIVYLIGENKINIHKADQKTFSWEALETSQKEIDKLLEIGLSGIREENEARRKGKDVSKRASSEPEIIERSYAERLGNRSIKGIQKILEKTGLNPRTPEEYLSPRDPTNLIGLSRG